MLLFSGKELINHRQKLIRIADEAEMGWKVVKEYDTNPLADDSDDERRIYRAESRANRKAKAEKAKRSKTRFNPYSYRQRPTATVTIPSGQPVDNYGDRAAKPGLCFLCHKPGHWKNTCELAKGAAGKNNKLSTNCFESNSLVASDNATVGSGSQHEYEALHTTLVENDCSSSPIGRLKAAESKWRQAGANAYIMRVILEGYSIPFRELPAAKQMKNNKSARDNMQFVISEVSKLLEKQCVTEVFEKPKVINPLTVAFSKTGKKRLVLDCRHINEYLVKYKFKYEDINTATQMFRKGSYLFSYDLKSAYHHIMIQNEMRTYLGFSVEHEGVEKYYVFNVLPFGLATSGHIFTKVLRVLIAYWRGQGHKVIMFLDDGIGGHLNFDEATKLSQLVQSGLTEFGFLLASDKCQWMPVTKLPWLGYLLDMAMGKLFVTDERISRLEIAIESFLYQMKVSGSSVMKVRFIASLVGQIISLQTVVGKLVSMRTRALYWCILSRASWNAPVVVTSEAIEELEFWLKNARALNMKGRFLEENIDCEIEVFCDASAAGYGGYFVEKDIAEIIDGSCVNVAHGCDLNTDDNCLSEAMRAKNANCSGESTVAKCVTCVDENACNEAVKVQASSIRMGPVAEECDHELTGSWSIEEADKSSTWREAETVKRVLASNVGAFRGKKLKVYSDNKNVKSILSGGSMKSDLQDIALSIHEFCEQRAITLIPEWIPREKNHRADNLSRCFDCDDWEITDIAFQRLNLNWGPHSVDRFSSNYNNKLTRFNSRWWVPGTEAVNAFDQPWSNECNWMVPPPRLASLCLIKLQKEKASGTLVVPEWKSAPYWVKLVDDKGEFVSFVREIDFLPLQEVVKKGRGNNGVFGKEPIPFRLIALKIRF